MKEYFWYCNKDKSIFLIRLWMQLSISYWWSVVVSAKGLLKECQFCFAPFWRDETILRRPTSVFWNLDVPNYHPSFRTSFSGVLKLINQRSKSADQKRERNKIKLFHHVCFDLYFPSLDLKTLIFIKLKRNHGHHMNQPRLTTVNHVVKLKKIDFWFFDYILLQLKLFFHIKLNLSLCEPFYNQLRFT